MDAQGIQIVICISNLFTVFLIVASCYPLMRGQVEMNNYYGIRFKESYKSDEAWHDYNRYGGRVLILWSIPIALLSIGVLFIPESIFHGWIILAASAPSLLYLVAALQIYLYIRSDSSKAKTKTS